MVYEQIGNQIRKLRLLALFALFLVFLPAQAQEEKIAQALQKTLQGFEKHQITFSPRAIYFTPNKSSLQRCENNKDFNASFKGFARVIAYYLYFRVQLDGFYPYATSETFVFNPKTGQTVEVAQLDQIIDQVDFSLLRTSMLDALKIMNKEDRFFLQKLLQHFERTYKIFSQTLTPEVIAALEVQNQQDYFDFSVLGFPTPPDCFAERFYTADVVGKNIFDREKTYFSMGSIDDYLYGFWWRRYHHGTINKVKELLDEAALFFEK